MNIYEAMSRQAQSCPKCSFEKVWKYGSRKTKFGVMRKFMCTKCGHVWEVEVSKIWSVNPELIKPIERLMERVIGDAERGIALKECGWEEFDAETRKALLKTGLCEQNSKTGRIRILSSAELPEDLATLQTARTLLDVRKALEIAQELEDTWRGEGRYKAMLQGLGHMLDSGVRTVSPALLAGDKKDEKMFSWDWFSLAHNAVNSLVLTAVDEMWNDRIEKVKMARRLLGDMVQVAEDVENVLQWRLVVGKLGKEALEALGFLWFADKRLQEIESPVGKRVAQRALLKVVGAETPKKIEAILSEVEVNYVNFPW